MSVEVPSGFLTEGQTGDPNRLITHYFLGHFILKMKHCRDTLSFILKRVKKGQKIMARMDSSRFNG